MVQRESGRAGSQETFARFKHVATSVSINPDGETRHALHVGKKPTEAAFGAIRRVAEANMAPLLDS